MEHIAQKVQVLETHLVQNEKNIEELGKKVSAIQQKLEEKKPNKKWCNIL